MAESKATSKGDGTTAPTTAAPTPFCLADHVVPPPVDNEGFVVAFDPVAQGEELRGFFAKHGFVVVCDAVPAETVHELQTDIFRRAKLLGKVGDGETPVVDLAQLDAMSWFQVYHSSYNERKGFLGFEPAETQASYDVRQSPRLHAAYAALAGTAQLWYKLDRFGMMRPTRGIHTKGSDETADRPDWKTRAFVHWDQNPFEEPGHCRLQGLLAVSEHTATSGGFHCIPGAHLAMTAYAEANEDKRGRGCLVDIFSEEDAKLAVPITMRKGSFVIWDGRLPHGNWPNDDATFRLVFYHTMFPVQPHAADYMRVLSERLLEEHEREMTPLGRKVLGLDPYTAADDEDLPFREPVFPVVKDSAHNISQWGIPPPPEPKPSLWDLLPFSTSYPAS